MPNQHAGTRRRVSLSDRVLAVADEMRREIEQLRRGPSFSVEQLARADAIEEYEQKLRAALAGGTR